MRKNVTCCWDVHHTVFGYVLEGPPPYLRSDDVKFSHPTGQTPMRTNLFAGSIVLQRSEIGEIENMICRIRDVPVGKYINQI